MNPVSAHKLLNTMHELAQAASNKPTQTQKPGEFQNIVKQAIDTTNELQMNASDMATRYEKGDPSVELADVMISLQKSSVSFQALTQVRNRLVNAYQDIMNMPI